MYAFGGEPTFIQQEPYVFPFNGEPEFPEVAGSNKLKEYYSDKVLGDRG